MQSEIKEALKAIKEERYATAEVLLEQLVHRKTTMRMEDIAAIAEEHGDWDDFGRWTFKDDDRLLAFVLAVQERGET
jgi:hypothetical protein